MRYKAKHFIGIGGELYAPGELIDSEALTDAEAKRLTKKNAIEPFGGFQEGGKWTPEEDAGDAPREDADNPPDAPDLEPMDENMEDAEDALEEVEDMADLIDGDTIADAQEEATAPAAPTRRRKGGGTK